jgi:hypothetical protein
MTEGRMICQHLRGGSGLGYYRVEVPPGVDFYETALCEECDRLLFEEGGWTMREFDFADWKLYCRGCFEEVLTRHRLIAVGHLAPDGEPDA